MNLQYKKVLLVSAGVAAVLGLAVPAVAQGTGQVVAQLPTAAADAAPASAQVGEIVITGSRLMNGNASTVPLTVVSTEQLTTIQPGPIAQALQALPVFVGAQQGSSGTNAAGTTLDLRFQGPNATLVLFDGKRLAPTTYDQHVDSNTVPQMLLKRVDVVTGGVSAVYGSDAVAGVVNFITDRDFNGFKGHVQGSIAGSGLASGEDIGFAAGTSIFGDKGHIEGSLQYQNNEGVSRRSKLPWGQTDLSQFGIGTAAAPFHNVDNAAVSGSTFGGIVSGATGAGAKLNGLTFNQNGVLSPFVHGVATGVTGVEGGGGGAYNDGSAVPATRMRQAFARFDYDLSSSTHFYVEGADNSNNYQAETYDEDFTNLQFSGTNPFLPSQYQFNGTFNLSKYDTQLQRETIQAKENAWFVIAGLEGKLGDWKWNAAFNEAKSTINNSFPSQINLNKLSAALDAVPDGAGNTVCRVTLTNPTLYPGCVPYNMFGPAAASQAAMNYITQPTSYESTNEMSDFTADISGSPFSDWAGPVQLAASAEARRNTLTVAGNFHPSDLQTCTGLTYNCNAANTMWFYTAQADLPKVGRSVGEVGLETEIPLLRDMPFFKNLSFNGAVRFTDYEVSGSVWTWKAGLSWEVNDEIKLRGAQSRDIRAPTLYELYQPETVTVAGKSDRLLGLTGHVQPEITKGNPNLTPEEANTTTLGVVYQPSWLPHFSFSVDAFHITINNVIVELDGAHTPEQQQCIQSGGTSPLCALQVRALGSYTDTNPANVVTQFYDLFFNADRSETYGADFEANYATDLFSHPLSLRGLVTWQPHSMVEDPGTKSVDAAGYAFAATTIDSQAALPRLRGQFIANYQIDNLAIMTRMRFRSHLSNANIAGDVYSAPIWLPAKQFYDVNLNYKFGKPAWGVDTEAYLNVQNVFNSQPGLAGRNTASGIGEQGGYVPGDDLLGRVFTVGVRFRH